MAENKAKKIVDFFGGLTGKAGTEIKSRKTRLQEAEDKAMNGDTDAAEGKERPSQSKKWTE